MSTTKKDSGSEINDWGMWANHVLAELKRLNESIEDIRKDLTGVTMEVVTLKVKSSLWGAAAGAITVIAILGVDFVKENLFAPSTRPAIQYQAAPYSPATTNPVYPPPSTGATPAVSQPAPLPAPQSPKTP